MKRVVISGLICMAIFFELLTFACCGVKNARLQVVLTDYAAVLESNGWTGCGLVYITSIRLSSHVFR